MTEQSLSLEIFFKHTFEDVEKKINETITDQNITQRGEALTSVN